MPIGPCACSSGVLATATAVLTLLLLPAGYYFSDWLGTAPPPPPPLPKVVDTDGPRHIFLPDAFIPLFNFDWPSLDLFYCPTLDLIFTFTMLVLTVCIYLCEWVQRKLLERRLVKLNQYLAASVERLHAWDAQQEHLEATLRMVENATSEYNLLLYLLLRQRRCRPAAAATAQRRRPPSEPCFYEKGLEDLGYLRSPTADV